jgi:hypothetical protein
MFGLIQIKYAKDSNNNPLFLALNPGGVGSTFTGPTGFYLYLNAVNTVNTLPTADNYSTKLSFHAPNQATAQAMGDSWMSAVNSLILEPQIISLDFFSQGCTFEQIILGTP